MILLSILVGSLGALPCAHAQNLLENAGIGSVQAGTTRGLARVGSALGNTQRSLGEAVAKHSGGHRTARRGHTRGDRHNGSEVVVVYPEGYSGAAQGESAPEAGDGFASEPIMIQGAREQASRAAEPPKITEIPAKKGAVAGKAAPPAIFVLKSGERIEAQRYLLTSNEVQLTADRERRTIPLSMLNLDETLAANHKRGVDLRLPSESGIVSLGF
jgi:hypothetical protein